MSTHYITSWDDFPLDIKRLIVLSSTSSSVYNTMSRTSKINYRQLRYDPDVLNKLLSFKVSPKEIRLRLYQYRLPVEVFAGPYQSSKGIYTYHVSTLTLGEEKQRETRIEYKVNIDKDSLDIRIFSSETLSENFWSKKLLLDPIFYLFLLEKRQPRPNIKLVKEMVIQNFRHDYQEIEKHVQKWKNNYLAFYPLYEYLKIIVVAMYGDYSIKELKDKAQQVWVVLDALDARPHPVHDNVKYFEIFNELAKDLECIISSD